MFTNRSFYLLIFVALLVITACSPQTTATPVATAVPSPVQDEPVTLHFGIPDGDNVLYAPYVVEFVNQVKTLSNGKITIEPVWSAGDSTKVGYEKGVIQLVREGKLDIGLAASRAFDNDKDNITSFQALQAPFLIDNDALVVAVATSEPATKMLDNLLASGLAGLTLWPEDLRHPFSVDPAKPLLSPEDFAGLDVRTTDTGVGEMLIKALGGNPIFEASNYQGAESGLRQGVTLTGQPAATGNVTFFPKVQVLFANGKLFGSLSEEQRVILHQAAAATQSKAIAERPSEVENGAAWCADGGTIVLASNEQVSAFQTAAQLVLDSIAQDSFNAEMITAIRELKTKTASAPGAQSCGPTVTQPSPEPEEQKWEKGLLPNGVWQAELSVEDIMAVGGVLQSAARESVGVHTFTFQDGKFTWRLKGENPGSCKGTYALVGKIVRLTFIDDCAPEVDDLQWRLDDEGLLYLHLVDIKNAPFEIIKANLEAKPYQKIADP